MAHRTEFLTVPRRSLSVTSQSGAGSQRGREEPNPGSRPRAASVADDAWRAGTAHAFLCPTRHNHVVCRSGCHLRLCHRQMLQAAPCHRIPGFPQADRCKRTVDLDVHIVIDNYATHKTASVKNWLMRRPRYHVHFTPTSASWINQVERWFAELTRKQLRRGVHTSTMQLETDIRSFIERHNQNPKPYRWTKSADDILASVKRFCQKVQDL